MKKMFNVFILLVAFVCALSAFEPNHKNDEVNKPANKKYAFVYNKTGDKETVIMPNFDLVHSMYAVKNTGNENEKWANENIPFYQETPTAEEYIVKIYKYLSEVPGFWRFYDMTEKEAANACGFKGGNEDGTYGKEWVKEYSDAI